MSLNRVVLLLGSNLGDKENNIKKALDVLSEQVGNILESSDIEKTSPVEFASSHNFLNIAVVLETEFSPMRTLSLLKDIETSMGRLEDSSVKGYYSDRIIDIDIVCFGHVRFESRRLSIPHHKHLYDRDFSRELLNKLSITY